MMIDVSSGWRSGWFGHSGGCGAAQPAHGVDGFYMKRRSRPLGFVAIGRKGTRFISVGKTPAK